ncbi:MAG: hypothetical protein WBC73_19080, partial [Phormidesmis sp.]
QWTASGYDQEPLALEPGAAQRIIYALVPQQPGQRLQLGERYAVTNSAGRYRITEGNFTVIAADQQPQNFVQEMAEVYAVEDTLPGRNATTAVFNGIQGSYVEEAGGDRISTVDVTLPEEADARVGNAFAPLLATTTEPGQRAYAQTTIAAGLYLGGSLTAGIGNQQDTLIRTTSTIEQVSEEIRERQTLNVFATPLTQVDSFLIETTETTLESSDAAFSITPQGELSDLRLSDKVLQDRDISSNVLEHISEIQPGEEFLMHSQTAERVRLTQPLTAVVEQDSVTESDTYPNFSPVRGEIAFGGVLNFGNTPWSPAANTARVELFARDTVFGRGSDSETGWRAELMFHPFGEQRREAFQYNESGNLVPIYQTQPMLDADGKQVIETLSHENGAVVDLQVNQFVTDERGDRIAQTVGTGRSNGPGLYLRVEDIFSSENGRSDDGVAIAGGILFNF